MLSWQEAALISMPAVSSWNMSNQLLCVLSIQFPACADVCVSAVKNWPENVSICIIWIWMGMNIQ